MRHKTVVVGSGRLGANIARHLSKSGESVDIIDKAQDAFRKIQDDFSGNITFGDATDLAVLDAVKLVNAQRIVIVTGDDNANIYISHLAMTFYDVPLIYVRLYDVAKGKLIENTRIKPIYPSNLSLEAFFKLEGADEL